LTALLDVGRDGHFATVLLGHVDVPDHQMTVVNAGHLPPLVVSGTGTYFVAAQPGAPIGVASFADFVPHIVAIPQRASILAYTDGLVERRGESLDAGLERLRATAAAQQGNPERLLDAVVASLADDGVGDDIALLAVRWID
ncbi:MAG TPA: PP2C family protein-serine/threonine phosphatase, partial [Acidimicrobiales bacterium]|nr:PP2C family protein-serine/threonine phosphatase [Acidimicrobiales bacterium]